MIRRLCLATVFGILLSFGCGDDDSTAPQGFGDIQVSLAMAGTDLDADGCQVTVDGASSRTLHSGESTTYSGLNTGSHVVELSGVAANCEVQGGASRSVQVAADATADVTFAVVCAELPTGSIEVTTVTTGAEIPPDDFVAHAGDEFAPIGVNATVTFDELPVGEHSVSLTDLPLHCSVGGGNPRAVTVQAAVTTSTTFEVSCPTHLGDRIAYIGHVEENPGDPPPPHIFTMTDQGTEIEQLTFAPLIPVNPDISPDGTRILFQHVRAAGIEDVHDIYVMNADGSDPRTLAAGEWLDERPAWSPDGSQIAFQSNRDGGSTAVWIMDSDGSNVRKLTTFPSWHPAWSPDGARIVFGGRDDGAESDLFIINLDGTGLFNLTPDPINDGFPAWSPDGQTIAFTSRERDGNQFTDIYAVSVNGGPITNLTNNPNSHDYSPDWSPDGSRIVFTSYRGGLPDIFVMDSQGGNVTRLTVDLDANSPDWGPLN
jgi:Tol biopolymer transport system component